MYSALTTSTSLCHTVAANTSVTDVFVLLTLANVGPIASGRADCPCATILVYPAAAAAATLRIS